MDQMIVEKLGSVSMSNGLVRIRCQTAGADGETRDSGELLIPATQFGAIASGLQQAGRQLQEKISEARESTADEGAGTGDAES